MNDKQCSIYVIPCVCIEIKGVPHPEGLPYLPNDYGLVNDFREWCWENKIYSVISAGHSGGGSFMGFFTPEDSVKICDWLKEVTNES
jgi:hypothetical protein